MSKIKLYKPTTNARRHTSVVDYASVLTKNVKRHKPSMIRHKNSAGRNSTGKITVRHRGGGYKTMVRAIDFKRDFAEGFKVNTIEYDPNRSAFISLVTDIHTGQKSYVIHSEGLEEGKTFGTNKEIFAGNYVALSSVPVGTEVSQVELKPGQGAKMARGAGAYILVTAREANYVSLKLPSGEIRKVLGECLCVIGRVGNGAYGQVRLGKAGRNRHKGFRPTVRGKVMNPVDHPHGGGEARNSIGLKYPKTPWGKHALGVRTRKPKLASEKLIVSKRYSKKVSS
jgi:large subunit ribosomal protein L2